MSRTSKYYTPIGLSCLSLLAIAYPAISSIPWEVREFQEKGELTSSEEINRHQLKERSTTAQAIKEAGVDPNIRYSLTISDYLDTGERPPKIRPEFLQSYFENDVIRVYDRSRQCIGLIKNRKFIWKGNNPEACK